MSHVQDTKKRKRTPSPSSHRPQKQQTTLNYRVLPPLPIPILPQPTPPKRHPIKSTLGSIHNYACHQIISEGEFGLVFFATRGVKKFAIKKLKLTEQDRRSGIYKREFHTLMRLKHPNVVRLYEVATNQRDQLFFSVRLSRIRFETFVGGQSNVAGGAREEFVETSVCWVTVCTF